MAPETNQEFLLHKYSNRSNILIGSMLPVMFLSNKLIG